LALQARLEEIGSDLRRAALAVFDLDRFKAVNDSLGAMAPMWRSPLLSSVWSSVSSANDAQAVWSFSASAATCLPLLLSHRRSRELSAATCLP
jgi:predicted signal transduction protein with EAL and GGDEF domain